MLVAKPVKIIVCEVTRVCEVEALPYAVLVPKLTLELAVSSVVHVIVAVVVPVVEATAEICGSGTPAIRPLYSYAPISVEEPTRLAPRWSRDGTVEVAPFEPVAPLSIATEPALNENVGVPYNELFCAKVEAKFTVPVALEPWSVKAPPFVD